MDNAINYALAAIGAVIAVVLMFVNRRLWLRIYATGTVLFGVVLFVSPMFVVISQTKSKTGFQAGDAGAFVARLTAVSLINNNIMIWFSRHTWDGTVPITFMMSCVFQHSLVVMSKLYYSWNAVIVEKHSGVDWAAMAVVMNSCVVLLHVTHLLRSSDFSTYPQHNIRINNHLRVDSLLNFVLSVLFLAFPDLIAAMLVSDVKSVSGVHMHLLRVAGSFGVGSAVMSLQAVGFLHESDKRSQFLTRIIHIVMQLPFCAYYLWQSYTSQWQPVILGIALLPSFINACLGYYAGGTINTTVRSKSN